MRTGAIFARGSCRALKWMALFGVVFALGAGSAAAQVSIKAPETVDEAGRLRVTVTAKVDVAGGTAETTLTVTATVATQTAIDGIVDEDKLLTEAEADVDYDPAVEATITVPANSHATEVVEHDLTGTILVQIQNDIDAEDEGIMVTVANGNITTPSGVTDRGETAGDVTVDSDDASVSVDVTIKDTDSQGFEWDLETTKPKEGSGIVVKLMTDPAPVNLTHDVPLSIDAAGYRLEMTQATLAMDDPDTAAMDESVATITITPPDSDGNRDDDTITLRALVGGTTNDLIDPLEIKVSDIHKLPADDKITAKAFQDDGKGKITKNEAMSVMEGGDPVHVTITVDRGDDNYPAGEMLKVEVMAADPAQGGDYRVDEDEFKIAATKGKQSMDIMLWARDDDDVGEEMLMLNLVVSGDDDDNGPGQSMGMFSIMIEDATTPMVSVKDGAYDAIMMALGDDPLNPGDMVEIMTDDLFMVMDGYTASYATSIEGSAVSGSTSGEMVMLTAEDAGEAKVTVTATATPMSDSLIITQDRANVAQLTFPVMVELLDLMVTLSMDDAMMNIPEGMSAMITAMANRPVEMDTMVELIQTEGTASPSDYMAEPITIMAGEMMGTTMLMAVADDMMEEGETLTLEGRVGEMKTNTVMFYIWDAAVPALPLIAQLLLAAFLAIGGYRRYLRR